MHIHLDWYVQVYICTESWMPLFCTSKVPSLSHLMQGAADVKVRCLWALHVLGKASEKEVQRWQQKHPVPKNSTHPIPAVFTVPAVLVIPRVRTHTSPADDGYAQLAPQNKSTFAKQSWRITESAGNVSPVWTNAGEPTVAWLPTVALKSCCSCPRAASWCNFENSTVSVGFYQSWTQCWSYLSFANLFLSFSLYFFYSIYLYNLLYSFLYISIIYYILLSLSLFFNFFNPEILHPGSYSHSGLVLLIRSQLNGWFHDVSSLWVS